MRRALALLLALAPLPALAQEAQCWVPYAGFEETVRHFDLARCPDNDPKPEEGFCRSVIQGGDIFIYVFEHVAEAGGPCLIRVDRMPFNDWARARGPVNRAR